MNGEVDELRGKILEHDNKIHDISSSVIQIKVAMDKVTASMEKFQISMAKHWSNQDVLAEKLNQILEKLSDDKQRITEVEHILSEYNTNGCNYIRNFENIRNHQLKYYDSKVSEFELGIKRNRESLDELKDIPNKIMYRAVLVAISVLIAGWVGMFFFDKG